eukprot:4641554-Pyramimonas_sp.AAC.1
MGLKPLISYINKQQAFPVSRPIRGRLACLMCTWGSPVSRPIRGRLACLVCTWASPDSRPIRGRLAPLDPPSRAPP